MRIQFPSASDLLFALALLTLATWQTQLVLGVIAVLLLGFHHWIIGGIIGLIASVAFTVRRRYRL